MSKKPKEQVKFNSKLSRVTRLAKARNAVYGRCAVVMTGLSLCVSLLTISICFVGLFFDRDDFLNHSSGDALSMLFFTGVFLSIVSLFKMAVIPGADNSKKNRSITNNCSSIADLMSAMPIKRSDAYAASFRWFFISMAISIASAIVLNTACLFDSGMSVVRSAVGFISVVIAVFYFVFFLTVFDVILAKEKIITIIQSVWLIIYHVIWFSSFFGGSRIIYQNDFFSTISGVPALILCFADVIAIVAIEKLYIEKKGKGRQWGETQSDSND